MSQHLSFTVFGKAVRGQPRSEPDSGKPTVRDRRGACGNVAVMGVGLRAIGKPMEQPPNPKTASAPHFYPDPHFINLGLPDWLDGHHNLLCIQGVQQRCVNRLKLVSLFLVHSIPYLC